MAKSTQRAKLSAGIAAKRELWEETNVPSIEMIAELPGWLKYDFRKAREDGGAAATAVRPRNGSRFASSAPIGSCAQPTPLNQARMARRREA
jgi:hypothetical protein